MSRKRKRGIEEGEKNKKQKTSENGEWDKKSTLLVFKHSDSNESSKIAAFDFDSTLVKTKTGRIFASNPSDWQLWDPSVITKLKELIGNDYRIVIFSNQGGIAKGNLSEDDLKKRMNQFVKYVQMPIYVVCACDFDKNRKPGTGMWTSFIREYNNTVEVDESKCFYVGDAAGRKKFKSKALKKARNDFSCDDRKFALNIGIKFYTPDEYFFGEPEYTNWDFKGIDIKKVKESFQNALAPPPGTYLPKNKNKKNEVIIFCGYPASGKSSFFRRELEQHGYKRVNMDTMKTHPKCIKFMKTCIQDGESVVVDNTNPDKASRLRYSSIAKQFGVPVRCFQFTTNYELCQHINKYREAVDGVKRVPGIAYNIYKKKFQPPTKSEGFEEVVSIDFVPNFENNEERENLFYRYY